MTGVWACRLNGWLSRAVFRCCWWCGRCDIRQQPFRRDPALFGAGAHSLLQPVAAHEQAAEPVLVQHQQGGWRNRAHKGAARFLHQDRHLAEHLAGAKPPCLARDLQFDGTRGDKEHPFGGVVLADQDIVGIGIYRLKGAAKSFQRGVIQIGKKRQLPDQIQSITRARNPILDIFSHTF